MVSSPDSPPPEVTDADWVEQQETTDPLEELEDTPTVRLTRSALEADETDVAEQETVVPLADEDG